jgi:hypothetical protein
MATLPSMTRIAIVANPAITAPTLRSMPTSVD